MNGQPIFSVSYCDRDWEGMEDLDFEDGTTQDVISAVASFMAMAELRHTGTDMTGHPLRKAWTLTVEVQDDREA